MQPDNSIKMNHWLSPFSFFYGLGVRLRNQLFNWGVLPKEQFDIPVICVGNLAAGGTGKTPHTEYIINILRKKYRIAVLSRGYKRKTSGFIIADKNNTSHDIGDEQFQIKMNFPDIIVALDANRRRGIKQLLALPEEKRPEIILLDDGFQHRYVTPSFNIILTDYNRLFYDDKLLPVGLLREPIQAIRHADIVIVTKCKYDLKPIEYRIIEGHMNLLAHQEVFFTRYTYKDLKPVFPSIALPLVKRDIRKNDDVLIISGIANPADFIQEIKKYSSKVQAVTFSDHHDFTEKDIEKINAIFSQMESPEKLIIVTEKDAARLLGNPHIPEEWKSKIHYQPIDINFHGDKEGLFKELITKHIETVLRDGILH
jgi:tetraacyldisaccharide 4'-kinase